MNVVPVCVCVCVCSTFAYDVTGRWPCLAAGAGFTTEGASAEEMLVLKELNVHS